MGLMFEFISVGLPFFVMIIFVIVIGTFIFTAIKGIRTWNYNNQQPVLTVHAKIVNKRTDISVNRTHHGGNNMHHNTYTSTYYFVTFEVESGDRMELKISGSEYGMLVEGDVGRLTFQGSRYHRFERERND